MSAQPTIEQRLTALEQAVAQIQRHLGILPAGESWLDRIGGSCKDEEAFLEAMEYGRAYRQADRPPDDDAGTES